MVLRLRSCFILGKMKLDNILGVKVSSSSSSRSFPDDLDDTDFAYSFDVEYDDATDPSSSCNRAMRGSCTVNIQRALIMDQTSDVRLIMSENWYPSLGTGLETPVY
ncbi:hypothetical protein ACFX15_018771 [Malus domestica]